MAKIKGTRLKLLELLTEHGECHAGHLLNFAPELETKGIHHQLKLMEENGWLTSRVEQIEGERHRPRRFYQMTELGVAAYDFACQQHMSDYISRSSSLENYTDKSLISHQRSNDDFFPIQKQAISIKKKGETRATKTRFTQHIEDLAVIYEWANLTPVRTDGSESSGAFIKREAKLLDQLGKDIPKKFHSKLLAKTVEFPKQTLSGEAMLGTVTPILQIYFILLLTQNSGLLPPSSHPSFRRIHYFTIKEKAAANNWFYHREIYEARNTDTHTQDFSLNTLQRQLLLKAAFEMRCLPQYQLSSAQLFDRIELEKMRQQAAHSGQSVALQKKSTPVLSDVEKEVIACTFHALHFDYKMVFDETAPNELLSLPNVAPKTLSKPKTSSRQPAKLKRTH